MATRPSSHPNSNRSRQTRLVLVIVILAVLVLAVVSAIVLARALAPIPPAVLRLAPAAGAVDDDDTILLSGSGWLTEEDVAICVFSTEDELCDAQNAVVTIEADRRGSIEADVRAGPLLRQGMTTFVAAGLDSGQVASRVFRVLRTADERFSPITPTPAPDGGLSSDGATSAEATPFPPAPETPADGWRGEYFANLDLAGEPPLVRNDLAIDFDWGDDSPAPGIVPADEFSARWTRTVFLGAGLYRFSILANDGARLRVDDVVVIDAWGGPSDQPATVDTQLAEGNHQISVDFFDAGGAARVMVRWEPILSPPPPAPGVTAPPGATPAEPGPGTSTPALSWTPTGTPDVTAIPTQSTATPTATPTAPVGTTSTATPSESPASTSTLSPSPGSTPTPTASPGSTPTPTITVPPGSTPTPTPTVTVTVPPGSTNTPSPTPTATVPPQLDLGLNPPEGQVNEEIEVVVSGQWTPGAAFYVVLLPRGMTVPPPVGRPITILAVGTTSTDGSERRVKFRVPPDDPQLLAVQPIQLVVYTDGWSQWKVEPFTIIE